MPASPSTVILPACSAGRLQAAAAFFNLVADPRKARAVSAGTNPGECVHDVVVDAMRESASLSRPKEGMAEEEGFILAAADFFVVPTATYRWLFVLVILAHERRRIVHVANARARRV